MESLRYLGMDELIKTALEHFVYQPVSKDMIAYLATAAANVITCDSSLMPQQQKQTSATSLPTPPRSPEARSVTSEDDSLPTLEEFITQLVVSSNVQVPTLMSTLVYLTRLKSKLQPMARGLRCTTHRIFLACLILAAKYLNDSSPKNKHWANYSHINTSDVYSFGFNRTEVNLMEKQLLFLLEWDLRITQQDLYRELDDFLEPLRNKIAERHARKIRHREEKRRQQEIYAAATQRYPSPASSRGHSRTRPTSPDHGRAVSAGPVTPPGLTYSSSGSSYTPSLTDSRQGSRSTTPSSSHGHSHSISTVSTTSSADSYVNETSQSSFYDSPVQIIVEEEPDMPKAYHPQPKRTGNDLLPYEISMEQYQTMRGQIAGKKRGVRGGVLSRLLGGAVAVR